MNWKAIVTIICLTIVAVAGLHYEVHEITFTAVGAIATWGLVNGVKNEFKKQKEDSD